MSRTMISAMFELAIPVCNVSKRSSTVHHVANFRVSTGNGLCMHMLIYARECSMSKRTHLSERYSSIENSDAELCREPRDQETNRHIQKVDVDCDVPWLSINQALAIVRLCYSDQCAIHRRCSYR